MKKQGETQIAIIGATQSGKTTLAAGLAKTSSPEFTVGFANQATSDYFQPRIAGIAAGHWPEGNIGEDKDLGLKINTPGGRSAMISFKEYMGERMNDENYLEHIVGKPNGALILLSPGMGLLTDPMKREKLIGNLKGIVDYLKSNKCVAIAFVVTACDRLKTDLRDFAEEFGNYAAEVTNYLNTSGMDWKRFDVTITGELADQQKPSIAFGDKNTAREPFVWIMDRVVGRKHKTAAKRVVGWLSGLALAGLAVFGAIRGGQYYSESAVLKAREKAVAGIEERVASATQKNCESDLKSATDDLAELIAFNKTRQCRFQSCETRRTNDVAKWMQTYDDARAEFFSVSMDERNKGFKTRGSEEECAEFDKLLAEFAPSDSTKKVALTNRWAELRPQIREGNDVERGNNFLRELDELRQNEKDKDLKGRLGTVREFKDKVSKWETEFVSSQNIRTNVLHRAELLIQSIEVELDSRKGNELQNQIDDMAKNAATKATVDALEQLRQKVDGWEPCTDKGETRKCEIRKKFVDNKPRWEQAYLDNCCMTNAEAIVRKIRGLNPNDPSLRPDDICNTLKTAYGFTNEWTKASTNVLSVATNEICEARSEFLSDFKGSFANKWDIYGKKKPEISNDDKKFIEDALDLPNPNTPCEKLSAWFLKELEKARSNAEEKWLEQQEKTVDNYIAIVKNMSAVDMFDSIKKDSYRNWYEKNCDNQFVSKVDSVVEQTVSKFFDNYIQEMKNAFLENEGAFNSEAGQKKATDGFDEFQKLCLAISNAGRGLTNSWCATFARKCVNDGKIGKGMSVAFEQSLTITQIDASAGGEDRFEPIEVKMWHDEWKGKKVKKATDELIVRCESTGKGWNTIFQQHKSLSLNPWTKSGIFVYAGVDELGSNPEGNITFRVFPRKSDYANGCIERKWQVGKHHCAIRIHCTIAGADIFELYEECRSGSKK